MVITEQEKNKLQRKYKAAVKQTFLRPTMILLYLLIAFAFIPAKYLLLEDDSDLSQTVAQFIGIQNFAIIFILLLILIYFTAIRQHKLFSLKKDLKQLTKSEYSGIIEDIIPKERLVILKGDAKVISFMNAKMPQLKIGQKISFLAYTHSKELIEVNDISNHLVCLECNTENFIHSKRCTKCNIMF